MRPVITVRVALPSSVLFVANAVMTAAYGSSTMLEWENVGKIFATKCDKVTLRKMYTAARAINPGRFFIAKEVAFSVCIIG